MGRKKVSERDPSFEYDSSNRMKYHPEMHESHNKPYTVKELAYICSTYGYGKRREVALAVGRTEGSIAQLVKQLRKSGDFDRYKEMGKVM